MFVFESVNEKVPNIPEQHRKCIIKRVRQKERQQYKMFMNAQQPRTLTGLNNGYRRVTQGKTNLITGQMMNVIVQ